MACAGSREQDLNYLKQWYGVGNTRYIWAQADMQNVWNHWNSGQDHDAIYDIWLALHDHNTAISYLVGKWSPFYPEYGVVHFLEHHTTENGGVTMAAILQAMYQANFTEIQEFIAYADAYRCSLWDEWFNIEHHAELVRGFKR